MVLAIAIGVVAIGLFWGLPLFVKVGPAWARLLLGLCGLFYLFWTINLVLTYRNKRIVASEDGVTYVNPFGWEARYAWDDVEIDSYSARGWVLVFVLAGKKVKLSGVCTNREEMVKVLASLGKY